MKKRFINTYMREYGYFARGRHEAGMTFSEVYERIFAYWPESINISDGRGVSPDGWFSSTLSRTYQDVEDRIDHRIDTWGSMMVWTMFHVFHTKAQKLREIGSDTLLTRTVDRTVIEEKYYENLHAEGWSEELSAYRRS